MLDLDKEATGDYFSILNQSLGIRRQTRRSMIKFLERICQIKQYNMETIYLAINLADRYLAVLAQESK